MRGKLEYELKCRDSQSGNRPFDKFTLSEIEVLRIVLNEAEVRHFDSSVLVTSIKIPFELIIDLPKPRYKRNILEGDKLGRIIRLKLPKSSCI